MTLTSSDSNPKLSNEQPEETNYPQELTDLATETDESSTLEEISDSALEEQKKTKRFRRILIETIQTLVLAFILYFAIDSVVARVQVENISMLPTLHAGEFLLVNRLAYKQGEYERGDIVIFHNPNNPSEDYIKRLIGIPGDVIDIQNGLVTVNGTVLNEPYLSEPTNYDGLWEVPEGFLFVLGDNRNNSYDSHSWGYLPQQNMVGKAFVIYWPPDDMRIIRHDLLGYAEVKP